MSLKRPAASLASYRRFCHCLCVLCPRDEEAAQIQAGTQALREAGDASKPQIGLRRCLSRAW